MFENILLLLLESSFANCFSFQANILIHSRYLLSLESLNGLASLERSHCNTRSIKGNKKSPFMDVPIIVICGGWAVARS